MLRLVTVCRPAKAFNFYSGHPDVCSVIKRVVWKKHALRFSPLLKNQHCQITIPPRIRYTRNHFVDVLPLNQYVFNIIFTVYFWIEVKYFMRNEQWIFYKNLSVLGQTLQRKNKVSTKDKQEPQHILKGKYSSKLGQSPLRKLHFRSNKKKLQVRKQIHTDRVHSS